jgi:hypothetical protein
MRILFDHGTPAPLIPFLEGHTVTKAKAAGWDRLVNGELLNAAEAEGFELLVTPDKNMRYQQNLTGRKIAIIVLGNAQWPVLRGYVERVVAGLCRRRVITFRVYSERVVNADNVKRSMSCAAFARQFNDIANSRQEMHF